MKVTPSHDEKGFNVYLKRQFFEGMIMCENTSGLFLIEFEFSKRKENALIHSSDLVTKQELDSVKKNQLFDTNKGNIDDISKI